KQRVVVRDKNLDVIAHLRQLRRRSNKIWHRSRVAVPDKDMKAAAAQIFRNPTADNAESEHSNVFPGSTCHVRFGVLEFQNRRLSLRRKPASRNPEVRSARMIQVI